MTRASTVVAGGDAAMALQGVGVPLPGGVHLWRIPLGVPASQVLAVRNRISPDELARADGYVFERDRSAFVAGRGALRGILARYLDCRPAEIHFEYGPSGKPRLRARHSLSGLQFNLSHSKALAVCAVTRDRAVGVDIEWMRPEIDIPGIAWSTFSAGECERLLALPSTRRLEAFYACWTRKEAYIKARGDGLSYPLDAFEVGFEPGEPASLRWSREGPAEVQRWDFLALDIEPGYAAALVVEGPLDRLLLLS